MQATSLRRIFTRFFPKKAGSIALPKAAVRAESLPLEQKKDLASRYLAEGEMALLQGNLRALGLFEAASRLDGDNPEIWYRQGLAFFEYGSEEGKEKALLLASKNFKTATQLKKNYFDAWLSWGNVLLQLGKFHEEYHYLIEAKNKYQKALEYSKGQPKEILAECYWDYGLVWSEISGYSGEALDVRLAIEAFQTSRKYQKKPSPEFLNDCGQAYLEMGLLINDSRLYLQSVEYLKEAIKLAPKYFDGWASLAESYSQLYINTFDDRYVAKASDAYAQATKICPSDAESWSGWAQLLGEAGRLNKDPKNLRLSIEKCARSAQLDPDDTSTTSQWVESLANLGMLTSRLDLIVEAEHKIIKATDQYPDDPYLWHAYGVCMIAFAKYYEEADYYEMAIEKLQYGLSIDRTDPELWHTLGLVHKDYAELTDDVELIERAHRFLTRAMDLKPACPALLFDTACTLMQYSEALEDFSSLEQAKLLFEILLDTHKETLLYHPNWLYKYACALEWYSNFTDDASYLIRSIEIFSHVLLIDPDFEGIHYQIALSYVELGHMSGESEYYRRAVHFYRLAIRENEENDEAWLDWGICLINLAHHTLDTDFMNQLYMDAELKITQAGILGNEGAHYALACLYSILGRTNESMSLIYKSLETKTLPSLDELLEDDWLENVRSTSSFIEFFNALEAKLQQTREE